MNYVESFNLLGVEAQQIPCITGEGAPTTATEGAVGCFYMDTLTGNIYKCTAVLDEIYTWETFEGEKGDIDVQGEPGQVLSFDADGNLAPMPLESLLENSGGISNTAKDLLLIILQNAVYANDQSANITALGEALGFIDIPDEPDTPEDDGFVEIPLSVVIGAVTRADGQKMTYDPREVQYTRASTNPIAVYVESGKTYKISLTDYSTYCINFQTFTYSTKGTDFTVVGGTQRIINGDFTRTYTSGWKNEDILYTADGTADIFIIQLAKGANHDETLTADDLVTLESMLTVKTNANVTPDTPVVPDVPTAETIPLTVVHGNAARVDGQKLTYDPEETLRGATNPLAFYVEEGKTYKVSLSSYDNYGFYPQGLSYSTTGTDFTVVDGTLKIFNGDFTRTLAPGWQYADYTFTADGTYQVIALQFRNRGNTNLTTDDITALSGMLTVTVE